jgi:hypothetical protein
MNVLDLMNALGGEILANKARATYNGKIVILGRLVGHEWEPTDIARVISAEVNTAESNRKKSAPKVKEKVEVKLESAATIDDLLEDEVPALVKSRRKVRAK